MHDCGAFSRLKILLVREFLILRILLVRIIFSIENMAPALLYLGRSFIAACTVRILSILFILEPRFRADAASEWTRNDPKFPRNKYQFDFASMRIQYSISNSCRMVSWNIPTSLTMLLRSIIKHGSPIIFVRHSFLIHHSRNAIPSFSPSSIVAIIFVVNS